MSDIIFSISSDTANGLVEPTTLSNEIIASGLAPALKIESLGDVLTINHTPDLSIPDSVTLVGVVAAHNGIDFSTVEHPGPTGNIIQEAIDVHAADPSAHHVRYTDAEAIAASSGALDHHVRYTDAEASGVAVQVTTSGISNHSAITDAHHARYTDAEAIAASSGALDHHFRYTDAEASGVAVQVTISGISNHAAISDAHHIRYTDAEAIAASSGALDHHVRYTDAEASGIAVQVAITGIANHAAITDAHHARYTDAEAIAASSGALDHHVRYTDAEASGVAVQVATTGIANHASITDAHHARYTDAEAIAASSGALDHHLRYTDAEASGVAAQVATTGIANHAAIVDAHHARYTDAEAIAASSGALDHHIRYTDAEASGVAVQVATTGIANHAGIVDAHHTRYTDAEAIAASSGALDHHVRYTDAEASGVAVQVAITGFAILAASVDAHHTRYTDTEAIAAASGALDHHVRYTDAEASGVAVQVVTSGIENHAAIVDAHHARYTDAEAIAAASGALDHHTRYTDAEASGIAVQVATTGISNHAAITDAHHARYTDAEAIAAATGNVTLQTAYDADSSSPHIVLTTDPLNIRDNSAPLSAAFEVQNNAGTINLLSVQGNVAGTQLELGAHDSFITGSNLPIMSIGDVNNSIKIWPGDRTFTSAPGNLFHVTGTKIHDYANVSFGGLNLQFTMQHNQSANPFNHFLLFNNGVTFKNENGTAANFGPGQTFIAQPVIQADGASVTMPQNRDFLSQPNFNTIGGGSLAVTSWGQIQLFGQINTGVTMTNRNGLHIGRLIGAGGTLTNERGILLADLNRGSNIIGIDSEFTGTGKTFINHPGTSPSIFGGEIQMSDGVALRLGTDGNAGIELSRSSAGVLRMIGVDGAFNEGLDWNFNGPDNVYITSSTSAGFNFDLREIAFGPTGGALADGTNNWFLAFAPGLRATALAGDYSEVLFTSASAISVVHAITNFATWTINAPTVSLGGGSIVDASNVLIQTNMSQGTNRYGLLITSNPTGGTLNYALRVTAGDVRHDGDYEHTGTNWAIHGSTPVAQSAAYTVTSGIVDRSYNANATTIDEMADVLGTLISDLQAKGVIG